MCRWTLRAATQTATYVSGRHGVITTHHRGNASRPTRDACLPAFAAPSLHLQPRALRTMSSTKQQTAKSTARKAGAPGAGALLTPTTASERQSKVAFSRTSSTRPSTARVPVSVSRESQRKRRRPRLAASPCPREPPSRLVRSLLFQALAAIPGRRLSSVGAGAVCSGKPPNPAPRHAHAPCASPLGNHGTTWGARITLNNTPARRSYPLPARGVVLAVSWK